MTETVSEAPRQTRRGGSGLQVERVHTTPGVHPYDEVEWERRDVVMTNWRDGSVNFEQRGVEFPVTWSVNAANIVTTKYFRGAVGTPARESSLRQLIDRVVTTYAAAGAEHGYFASAADTEVFEHELTWMLLHQVFSFNSPVWFNVGTSAPQQVSACFILAVDDHMDSILNWYREEGLIFKGGSGAGLNLSRIRSSKELLSSGGTASGPVSFMRGADASAGTIKSGGATRRAAKMVVLDVDHPDIEEFIDTKAREEDKIRALRDAGFDMDLGGKDIVSVQYQNANNSVRVSDEFMRAVEQGKEFGLRARLDGSVLETVDARTLWRKLAQAAWECADPGVQYDDTINDWHTSPEAGRITASNPCSEYLHLDNSSCNLASLNLMTFVDDSGTFAVTRFQKAVELVITAMDISICFADFPTESIARTTRAFRQLGIGYANLGALLMATGHAYDSDGGRALAGAITSLMTGTAYRRSAELAGVVGPYEGYARNADAHKRVMRKHAAANDSVRAVGADDAPVLQAATTAWQECLALGERNGYRNAQASVIAPTGCLVPSTLVTSERGLARLSELGDEYGSQWQDLGVAVATDEGPREATRFFVNGEEPTRRVVTAAGHTLQGTYLHRIRVVDVETGEWNWKRLMDVEAGDVVPVQTGTLVGVPRAVPLPALDQAHYLDDRLAVVPDAVDADLAELVGYVMGDGSLNAEGLRLRVSDPDLDVVDRLRVLAKGLFALEAGVEQCAGYLEVTLHSARLARWWQAAGFATSGSQAGRQGTGRMQHVPAAIRETNDPEVYAAFLRGVFEAAGRVQLGVPSVSTSWRSFAADVQSLLLTLGLPSAVRDTVSAAGGPVHEVRLRDVELAATYGETVGFLGTRKARLVAADAKQTGDRDLVVVGSDVREELAPLGHPLRSDVAQHVRRTGGVPRPTPEAVLRETRDARPENAPDYVFEVVAANEDGGVQPTYDLSVPDNVTYVANGFVSHNTIGLMMDCDTTGLEPDLALVKFKKLVGGGSMQIVNRTVPRALRALGYQEEQVEAIVEHIAEHGNVVDAPGLRTEHYEVFDCAMGARSISPMGHVSMMAAIQPFVSGALSKTVNLPAEASVEDVENVYFQGWKLGLKALAIYRNNSKVGQPLSDKKDSEKGEPAVVVEYRPTRKRLPKKRRSSTISFSVAGAEGYLTAGEYGDGSVGEVFIKMSKQGSTLAGVMDAFSVSISIGLQYGVPLEAFVAKYINMRFDPAGMTDDADIRIAQSVMDYLFRRLALDYLPYDTRAELGIFTAPERAQTVVTSYGGATDEDELDVAALATSVPVEKPVDKPRPAPATQGAHSSTELLELQQGTSADAPLCMTCGVKMRPAGSCYVCESCGSTSGCS